MPLSFAKIPALASHTLAVLLGFSLAGIPEQKPDKEARETSPLPAKGRTLLSLPEVLRQGPYPQPAREAKLLSVLYIGHKKSRMHACIAEQAVLRQVRSRPDWIAEAENSDLSRLMVLFSSRSGEYQVAASDDASNLPPCPGTPRVYYGTY